MPELGRMNQKEAVCSCVPCMQIHSALTTLQLPSGALITSRLFVILSGLSTTLSQEDLPSN